MRKLLGLFLDVDAPPDRVGIPGFVIMGVFLLFCTFMWFHHSSR